ncbi:hypothetical protein JANAI62_24060 [Jannaschia pagri]|uniref:Lipoprotein n=1 Tax=Jannaschia pagri TaxID=2829797 RepID=A0ABQ4NMZ7_9RHOB|nr:MULTISPECIES: hypothetical protein [unclassified Jannaschia]GIT91949.1 hypothetical protein JANAI61_24070 [Jannaschia sp. AI_61]GIT95783.1 hypothetical protein JANAI62_24060 [Jannaschia sp. AI_62]
MALGRILAVGALVVALAGCGVGQSRLNPLNWFGSSSSEAIAEAQAQPRLPIVDQVVSLDVAATPGGAIISTVGLPPTQGFWEADLVRLPSDDPTVMLFEFRILPPLTPRPAGPQPSREVLGGAVVTNQDLAGIRTIAVQGQRNRRSVRR